MPINTSFRRSITYQNTVYLLHFCPFQKKVVLYNNYSNYVSFLYVNEMVKALKSLLHFVPKST
jgi:hypothetical protein